MAEGHTVEESGLPAPDLPSVPSSVGGTSGTYYISLQNQNTSTTITIRRPDIQGVSRNMNMVPRADDDNAISLHPGHMQNINAVTGTNFILMHEIPGITHIYHRQETRSEAYFRRLRTFHNWHVPFLDPAVLAEANFSYTGMGDTVRCNECGGELANWEPGNDPRLEHLIAFGFLCD